MQTKRRLPCSNHLFLFIASFLPCKTWLVKLCVTSNAIRRLLQYAALTDNDSSILLPNYKETPSKNCISRPEFLNMLLSLPYSLKVLHRIKIRIEEEQNESLESILSAVNARGTRFRDRKIDLEFRGLISFKPAIHQLIRQGFLFGEIELIPPYLISKSSTQLRVLFCNCNSIAIGKHFQYLAADDNEIVCLPYLKRLTFRHAAGEIYTNAERIDMPELTNMQIPLRELLKSILKAPNLRKLTLDTLEPESCGILADYQKLESLCVLQKIAIDICFMDCNLPQLPNLRNFEISCYQLEIIVLLQFLELNRKLTGIVYVRNPLILQKRIEPSEIDLKQKFIENWFCVVRLYEFEQELMNWKLSNIKLEFHNQKTSSIIKVEGRIKQKSND